MEFIPIIDADGVERKMAGHLGPDGIFRPVHHSDVVHVMATPLQRPNDITAYTAGDAIGSGATTVFEFDIGALGLKGGLIVASRFLRDSTGNPTIRYRGTIYDAAPTSPPAADNAAASWSWANRAARRGYVDYLTSLVGSDCCEWAGVMSNVQGVLVAPTDGIVRMVVTVLDGFTPSANVSAAPEISLVV